MNNPLNLVYSKTLALIASICLAACYPPTEPVVPAQSGGSRILEGTDVTPSPDGTQIAFLRETGLFKCDTNGSNVEQLYASRSIRHPCWSPDGKRIGFVQDDTVRRIQNRMFLLDVASRSLAQPAALDSTIILDDPSKSWKWSSDGTMIASYAYSQGQAMLIVVRIVDGAVLDRFSADQFYWSPTNPQLVLSQVSRFDSAQISIVTIGSPLAVRDTLASNVNLGGWLSAGNGICYFASSTYSIETRDTSWTLLGKFYLGNIYRFQMAPTIDKIGTVTTYWDYDPDAPTQFYLSSWDPLTGASQQLVTANESIEFTWAPDSRIIYYEFNGWIYRTKAI